MRAEDGVSFDIRREEDITRDILHLQGCTTLRNTPFSWWEFPV